jgi:hypothetical protein
MKKIALFAIIFVTLLGSQSCTKRLADDIPQIGDSLSTTVPMGDPANPDVTDHHTDPQRVNYILPMDSTSVRREAGSTLITVIGPLGDGCQKFEYIDSIRDGKTLKLTFWASRPKDPNTVCTQQMQYYQKEIRIDPAEYSGYSVVQPSGPERTFSITR